LADAAASFAEHEVSEVAVAWMWERPVRFSMVDPLVEQGDGVSLTRGRPGCRVATLQAEHPLRSPWPVRPADSSVGGTREVGCFSEG